MQKKKKKLKSRKGRNVEKWISGQIEKKKRRKVEKQKIRKVKK